MVRRTEISKDLCKASASTLSMYSHLSNKREVTLTEFEKKIHPPCKFPSCTFIDLLDLFHPPLLVFCIYVLDFSKKSYPSRLFQPPRLSDR